MNIKKIITYLRLQTDTANQAYRQETEESVEEEFKQQILQKKTRTIEIPLANIYHIPILTNTFKIIKLNINPIREIIVNFVN